MKSFLNCSLFSLFLFASFNLLAQDAALQDPYVCPPCHNGTCDSQTYDKPGECPECRMALIKKSSIKNVAIFIYDGVEILDFSGPGEVFAAAHHDGGAFRVYTVAINKDPLISQGFVKILPEFSIEDCPKPNIMVFPGGSVGASVENPKVIDWVKHHAPDLTALISVCNGAFILNKAGMLEGKKATTWYGAIDRLKELAPKTEVLSNTRWVDNGKVITTAGVSAGIDGALHVVEKLCGMEVAKATAQYMEYDKWDPEDGVVVRQP